MHSAVFTVIVTLSAYLFVSLVLGPRLTLPSVGGVYFVGDVCRSRLCVLGSGDCGNGYWGHGFFLFGTGDIPDSWLFCVVGATGAAAHVSFVVPLFVGQFGGFLVFPCVFCPLLFGSISLGFSSQFGSGGVGGRTAGRGLSRVGYIARDVAEDLLCFLFFLLLQLAAES